MKILSAEQIRNWDLYTIQNEPISSWELMERASFQCTKWLIENDFIQRPIKIICGKGNNGGDGLAIACQLLQKNIPAEVYILEFGAVGTNDFQINLNRLRSITSAIHYISDTSHFPSVNQNDVIIDAMFGFGLNRPLEQLSASLVNHLNQSVGTIVSIDLPSGMFADEATTPHTVIRADYTLTFQSLKLCFLLPENEQYFGALTVLPIGLLKEYVEKLETPYHFIEEAFIRQLYKPRARFSHKGTFGHSLIVAGEKGKMGAAVLATKSCLRSGAGLVSALVEEDQSLIMQLSVPEAMVAFRKDVIEFGKYKAIGIGPGLGTSVEAAKLLEHILENSKSPVVIDADGLNILSNSPNLLAKVKSGTIITPHPKEFERLFGPCNNDYERLQLAISNAVKLGIYIILKGHRTAIATPDGKVFFNSTGNPGMATAGSGDVLTGVITGLLSQSYSSHDAAVLGVYLHGLAGDIAAKIYSEEALIAGDIINHLGDAYKAITNYKTTSS